MKRLPPTRRSRQHLVKGLPDRERFRLGAEQWETFQKALATPPRPAPRLAKLLKESSVFERGSI
jgi:uncharacterized protein (DUF1778 family)